MSGEIQGGQWRDGGFNPALVLFHAESKVSWGNGGR